MRGNLGIKFSRHRQYKGVMSKLVTGLAVTMALYHIFYLLEGFYYLGIFMHPATHVGVSMAFLFVLTFLLFPATKTAPRDRLPWYDTLIAFLSVFGPLYWAFTFEQLMFRQGVLTAPELVLGIVTIAIVFEAMRRTGGWFLFSIVLAFLIYPLCNQFLPGILHGGGFSFVRVIGFVFLTQQGIFGTAYEIVATVVVCFIIFAAFLQVSGASGYFINFALALLGKVRGGAAKAAVIASSLLGTLTGSSVANVVGTGVVTIPLMKKSGYQPHMAGAIEAAASTGGQIMPPIMGAAAFIMAEFLEIRYVTVCLAALLPAILYYLAVFIMVHLEAVKLNIEPVPIEELPSLKKVLREGWHFFLPIVALIFFLAVLMLPPIKSALYALAILILISSFNKKTRMGPKKLVEALAGGAIGVINIGGLCAGIGVIMAVMQLTGFGISLSSGLIALSGGNIAILLILAMVACIILGMGLATTPVYILLSLLVAPSLAQVGILPLAAHLFILYFGIMAQLTPPVCLASFAAAGVAGSNPMKTGLEATRLALVGYIIPFMFVLNPVLLLQGKPLQILISTVTALVGTAGLATGLSGYIFQPVSWLERGLLIAGGIILVMPGLLTDGIGFSILAAILIRQIMLRKASPRSM